MENPSQKCDGVVCHLIDSMRGASGRVTHADVVKRHHTVGRRELIQQRRIPVIQVAAKVLEENKWHATLARLTIGILDAICGANNLGWQI